MESTDMQRGDGSSAAAWRFISGVAVLLVVFISLRPSESSAEQTVTVNIPVEGMSCGSCAASIKRATKAIEGVRDVRVDLVGRRARVEYDAEKTSPEKIGAAIEGLGYKTGTPVAESR